MSEVFFSSDLHLFHNREFIWEARGFNSVEEMNEAIIERFNSVVKKEDTLYLLGDCVMGADIELATKYLDRINGHKLLCIGNHDNDARLKYWMQQNTFEAIEFAYRFRYKKKGFYCTHFPTILTNGEEVKWINLYAHTHQRYNWIDEELLYQTADMYNVGVDAHNCYPVSLDTIVERVKDQIRRERENDNDRK